MADRVKYIKIAVNDKDNLPLTNELRNLTEITIPYSNGNEVRYPVESITPGDNFYLYVVGDANYNPNNADASNLLYNFSGSLITAPFAQEIGMGYFTFTPNPNPLNITQSVVDNLNFYTTTVSRYNGIPNLKPNAPSETIGVYQLNTYPQKDLIVRFKGSVTDDGSSGNSWYLGIGFGSSVNYLLEPYNIPDNLTQSMSPGSSNTSFNIQGIIPSQSLKPGDFIFPYSSNPFTINQGDASEMAFDAGTFFTVESNAAVENIINKTIISPAFTTRFKGSNCDILLNNVELYRENPFLQDIDYSENPLVPVNNNLIISGTAARGTVPESYYTSLAQTRIRYTGVKNQSSGVNVYNPNAGTSSFGEPINIGTYGQVPSIDSLDVNIYEFEWGGGTNPEIQGYGAVKMGKILQVSSKDLVKTINPSANLKTKTLPTYLPIPAIPSSWNRNSTYRQTVSDYYLVLNGNNKTNDEISMFAYPNQQNAGSNPTLPQSTKILTTEYGVPLKSSFMITSSAFGDGATYGLGFLHYSDYALGLLSLPGFNITQGIETTSATSFIRLLDSDSRTINEVGNNYSVGRAYPTNYLFTGKYPIPGTTNQTASFGPLQKSLNEGNRWFVTFYKNLEAGFDSDTLEPLEMNQTPLGLKGVNEIVGIATSSNSGPTPRNTFLLLKDTLDPSLSTSADSVNQGITTGEDYTINQIGWANEFGSTWPNPANPAIGGTEGTFYDISATTTSGGGSGMTINVKMGPQAGTIKRNLEIYPEPTNDPLTNLTPNSTSSIFRIRNGLYQSQGPGTGAYGYLYSDSNGNVEKLVIASGFADPSTGYWRGGGVGYSDGQNVNVGEDGIGTQWTLNSAMMNNSQRPYFINIFGSSVTGGTMKFVLPQGFDSFDIAPEIISVNNSGGGTFTSGINVVEVDKTDIGNPINDLQLQFHTSDYNKIHNGSFAYKIGGGGLGFFIWKARAVGKNEFVMVQDSVTGGVGAGAFTSKYVPDYIDENFENITKEYGTNTSG